MMGLRDEGAGLSEAGNFRLRSNPLRRRTAAGCYHGSLNEDRPLGLTAKTWPLAKRPRAKT